MSGRNVKGPMGILNRGSRAGFSVSMLVTSVFLAMILLSFGSWLIGILLGIVLPGSIASTVGGLAMLGLLGVHYVQTWPPWGTAAEHRAYNEFNPDQRTEPIDPDDVAEVLSLVGDDSTNDGQLKGVNARGTLKLAEAIFHGTRGDEDPERVIAQLERIEGVSTEEAAEIAMDRLTTLFRAAERSVIERLLWKIRQFGLFLTYKSFQGINDEPMKWSDIESIGDQIRMYVVPAIVGFALYAPADRQVMREALDADEGFVRGHAAKAYGGRALFNPDESGELANRLVPLTDDTDKQVRIGATYGLEVVAMHDETARQRLEELSEGPDPDLREIASELLAQIRQQLGSEGMNVDDSPAEHAVDPDELASHAADLDEMLDDESTPQQEPEL